jgi:hypothetical protein
MTNDKLQGTRDKGQMISASPRTNELCEAKNKEQRTKSTEQKKIPIVDGDFF